MNRRKYKRGQIAYARERRTQRARIRAQMKSMMQADWYRQGVEDYPNLLPDTLTEAQLDAAVDSAYDTLWAMRQGFRLKIDFESGKVSW